MNMYRVTYWMDKIEEFEIIKSTDNTITYTNEYGREAKENKRTNSSAWFTLHEEARQSILDRLRNELEICTGQSVRLQKRIDLLLSKT